MLRRSVGMGNFDRFGCFGLLDLPQHVLCGDVDRRIMILLRTFGEFCSEI